MINGHASRIRFAWVLALSITATHSGNGAALLAAQSPAPLPSPTPPSPPGHRDVKDVRLVIPGGGRLDWSAQGDLLAFDRRGPEGHHALWVASPTGGGERCLSCDVYEVRKANLLSPVWHPSGQGLVVQVQDLGRRPEPSRVEMAGPHRAVASALAFLPREGRQIFFLTPPQGNRLDPFFSHEGGLLSWSERLHGGSGPWGDWAVRVADWELKRGVPRMGKIRTLTPGPGKGLVLGQGFTPDDRGVLVTTGGVVLTAPLQGTGERALTTGATVDHGPARFSPRSGPVVWASDRDLPESGAQGLLPYRRDLWLAEGEGGGYREERLTFFNHPRSDHFLGEALIDDFAWSPQGDRLAVHVVWSEGGPAQEGIYLVTLAERFRR
jgi:hypothetical protein